MTTMLAKYYETLHQNIIWRKAYHIFGGGLVILALISLEMIWLVATGLALLAAIKLISRRISYALIGYLLVIALTRSKTITLGTAVIFVVGDGMAALVGKGFGRQRWPWPGDKTLLGSLAFFVSASLALLLTWGWVFPSFPLTHRVLLAVPPALAGMLAESRPPIQIRDLKADDNLAVILVSGLVLYGMAKLIDLPAVF